MIGKKVIRITKNIKIILWSDSVRNYKKRSKYGVDQTTKGKQNRTVVDRKTEKEICFDSLLEKRFYEDIVCVGLDSGEIVDYELQKKYKLQPSFKHNGKTIRAIDYVADFWVSATRSQTVKSLRTSNGFPLFGELVV